MGNVNYTLHHAVTGNAFLVRWASLSTSSGSADSGLPFPSSADLALAGSLYSDKAVQVYTFAPASYSRILIQGSNQMDTVATASMVWATLTDPQGNPLVFVADNSVAGEIQRIEGVLENPWFVRPIVASINGGAAAFSTQSTTVDLLITSVRSARSGI